MATSISSLAPICSIEVQLQVVQNIKFSGAKLIINSGSSTITTTNSYSCDLQYVYYYIRPDVMQFNSIYCTTLCTHDYNS